MTDTLYTAFEPQGYEHDQQDEWQPEEQVFYPEDIIDTAKRWLVTLDNGKQEVILGMDWLEASSIAEFWADETDSEIHGLTLLMDPTE